MADVVVIGAGVGGLAAAIRLRVAGHRVVVCERSTEVGGKLAARCRDGFVFDTGPSLLTLPHVFEELFACAGERLGDHVELARLDPQFAYRWPDGSRMVVTDDRARTAAAFDRLAPGAGAAWKRFDARGAAIWEVAERTFFAGPMESPSALLRRMRSPLDLLRIDPLTSLHRRAARTFADRRLVAWAGRYATYSGSSPHRAPATLACIPHLETRFGAWHVRGGLANMAGALGALAERVGVDVRTGVGVAAIRVERGRTAGVELATGEVVPAPVVVANVDAGALYQRLLPNARALRRVRHVQPSSSGFALLIGVAGRTVGLAHHNVLFSADPAAEFSSLFASGTIVPDPTVYVCCPTVTDPTMAPAGDESWFVLVNAPSGASVPWAAAAPAYRDRLIAILASRGLDLTGRIRFVETITPHDIERRHGAPGGAIYGTSSNGALAAFRRPANRGPVPGLYLVGGSSHPGGGLPLVTMSARIVASMVEADGW